MQLKLGDRVNKVRGYEFPGTIRSILRTSKGELRFVVEMDTYGLLHIFNEEQLKLEGELHEGGMVEKCKACEMAKEGYSAVPPHICLNKKEERCSVCLAIPCYCKFSNIQQSKDFNRETTKCCCGGRIKAPASHSLNGCVGIPKVVVNLPEPEECTCKGMHDKDCPANEELEVPEKLIDDEKLSYSQPLLRLKINEILTYLASKENK